MTAEPCWCGAWDCPRCYPRTRPEPEELRAEAPPEPARRVRSVTILLGPGRSVELREPDPETVRVARSLAVALVPAADVPVAAAVSRFNGRAVGVLEALGRVADLPEVDRHTLRTALARISL